MKTVLEVTAMVLALAAAASTSFAADDAKETGADRAVYNRLVRELRTSHAELKAAYDDALAEARAGDGKARDDTKAKILALRDEIDRKTTRLLMVSVRHGWDVPDFSSEADKKAVRPPAPASRRSVFLPVDGQIRSMLAREAAQIAARVHLPVISFKGKASRG